MKTIAQIIVLFFIAINVFSQDAIWESSFEIDRVIAKGKFIETTDSCYVFTGMPSYRDATALITVKVDKYGKKLWEVPYYPDRGMWNRALVELEPDVYTAVSLYSNGYFDMQEYSKDGETLRSFYQDAIFSKFGSHITFINDKFYQTTYLRTDEGWLYEAVRIYDLKGEYLGVKTYDSLYYTDYRTLVIQELHKLEQGGYFALGAYQKETDFKHEDKMFFFDDSVNIIKRIDFERPERAVAGTIETLKDNNVILFGRIAAIPWAIGQPRDTNRAFIWKFDLTGETIWLKEYPTTLYSVFSAAVELDNGDLIAVGNSVSELDSNVVEFYLLKTDSEGNVIYKRTWGYPDQGALYDALINRNGNLVVLGKFNSYPYLAEFDVETLDILNRDDENNCAINISPNPAISQTDINISIDDPGNYRIDIVDETGRIVEKLKNTWLEEGIYQEQLDVSGYNSGRYFLRLTNDLMTITKLLCIVK